MSDLILTKEDGAIVTVILNNPSRRNALCRAAWSQLTATLKTIGARDDVRCVIIRGAGEEAFAAGADISEFPENRSNAEQAMAYGEDVAEALDALLTSRHPTIAMIYGACTGGGLEIASCCDMRIAAQSARFGVPINRIGHAFAPAEMKPVIDLIGPALVLELLLEGRIFDADEALARGLVNRVVADDQLNDNVQASARRIASGAPLAARMTKTLVRRVINGGTLSDEEIRDVYAVCDSEDYAEGVRAFLAKEKPTFKGR
jgi:enoyl-CoA hydratase